LYQIQYIAKPSYLLANHKLKRNHNCISSFIAEIVENSMKRITAIAFLSLTTTSSATFAQGVAIGSTAFTPSPDALLELRSTSSGFLMPRMTEAQKNGIPAPSEGLLIWQTDNTVGLHYYSSGNWNYFGGDDLGSHAATRNVEMNDHWISNNGSDNGIRINDDGNVGIGVSSPSNALHVVSDAANKNVITVQSSAANGWSSVDFLNHNGNLSTTFGFANSGTAGIFTGRAYMNSYNNDFVLTRNSTENSIFISGSSGNIGINNNNPSARLDVRDGNVRLSRNGASVGELQLQGTGTGSTSLRAGAQGGSNITYTLPITGPTEGQVMTSSAGGQMQWQSIHTLLGAATRAVNGNGSSQGVNNATFVNVNQMTMSVVPGSYIVLFNAEVTMSTGNTVGEFIVRVNSTDITETSRKIKAPGNGDPGNVSIISLVNVTDADNLVIRFRRSSGSGTMTIMGRTLMLVRVG
jgi:hypothetical protein